MSDQKHPQQVDSVPAPRDVHIEELGQNQQLDVTIAFDAPIEHVETLQQD